MKFTYEMYEHCNRGLVFRGYKTVQGQDSDTALRLAQSGLSDSVMLFPVYVPQQADTLTIQSIGFNVD